MAEVEAKPASPTLREQLEQRNQGGIPTNLHQEPLAVPILTLRSVTPGARPPAGKSPGELWVNLIDRTFGVIGTDGTPITLIERRVLIASETYYVDAAGNDANDGAQATPWLTLRRAFDHISKNLDLNSWTVTINVGAGAFVGASLLGNVGLGNIKLIGAGSALTTIIASPSNDWSYGACLGLSNIVAKVYVCGFTFEVPLNWYAVYADNAYNIQFHNSYTPDFVFIVPAGGAYTGVVSLRNSYFFTTTVNSGTWEIRASVGGGSLTYLYEVDGGVFADDAGYTLTGALTLGAFLAAYNRATIGRNGGAVTGDITGVAKAYSLAIYTSMTVNNNAWYPGPPGTADVSSMVNGVMGTSAFDTDAVYDWDKKRVERETALIASGELASPSAVSAPAPKAPPARPSAPAPRTPPPRSPTRR